MAGVPSPIMATQSLSVALDLAAVVESRYPGTLWIAVRSGLRKPSVALGRCFFR